MPYETRDLLLRQLETAWQLTSYHLEGLTTDECLWRPNPVGLTVHRGADGLWRPDWPEREGYDIGPATIAWLTWHIGFWWSMAFDHAFGSAKLTREDLTWPGTGEDARAWITRLHEQWRDAIRGLTDDDLRSSERSRWPLQELPFGDVVAWANIELMKNAAEIGYARFLYGVR